MVLSCVALAALDFAVRPGNVDADGASGFSATTVATTGSKELKTPTSPLSQSAAAVAAQLASCEFQGKIVKCYTRDEHVGGFHDGLWQFALPAGWKLLDAPMAKPFVVPFVLTDYSGRRHYGTALTVTERVWFKDVKLAMTVDDLVIAFGNNHAEIPDNAMFYTPKAIILLADEPLFSTQRRILFSMASAGGAALHAWARLLTSNELPLPAPGKAVSFTMSGCPIEVAVPAHDDFPQLDLPLAGVFHLLSIGNIVDLMMSVLMDRNVFLVSSNYNHLTLVAESVRTLIYPVDISTSYTPLFTSNTIHLLDAIGVSFFGIHKSYLPSYMPDHEEVVIVDIDANTVSPRRPIFQLPEATLTALTKRLRSKLFAEVMELDEFGGSGETEEALKNARSGGHIFKSPSNRDIQAIFLDLFVTLLGNFTDYLLFVRLVPEPVVLFEKIRFRKDHPNSDFHKQIVATSFFEIFVRTFGTHEKNKLFTSVALARKTKDDAGTAHVEPKFVKAPVADVSPTSTDNFAARWKKTFQGTAHGDPVLNFESAQHTETTTDDADEATSAPVAAGNLAHDAPIPLKQDQPIDAETQRVAESVVKYAQYKDGVTEMSSEARAQDLVASMKLLTTTLQQNASSGLPSTDLSCANITKMTMQALTSGVPVPFSIDFLHQQMEKFAGLRALFALEIQRMCDGTRGPRATITLQDASYEWLNKFVFRLLQLSIAIKDTTCLRILTGQLVRISRVSHTVGDLLSPDKKAWMVNDVWEEVILATIDVQRRTVLHPELQNEMKKAGAPSGTIQDVLNYVENKPDRLKAITDREEALIVEQLQIFGSVMIAFGLHHDMVRMLICDNMAIVSALSDEVSSSLSSYLNTAKEAYELRCQRRKFAEEALNAKTKSYVGEKNQFEVPTEIQDLMLPREYVVLKSLSATYTSPHKDVFVGSFFLTTYRFIFKGAPTKASKASITSAKIVSIEVTLGSILEMQRTDIYHLETPVAISFKTFDSKSFYLGFQDDSAVNSREVMNAISRIKSVDKSDRFLYQYDMSDLLNAVNLTKPLNKKNLWKRPLPFIADESKLRSSAAVLDQDAVDMLLLGLLPDDYPLPSEWRMFTDAWKLCSSYPISVLLPADITGDDLSVLCKFYEKKRFPVLTWVHPVSQRVLLRSAMPKNKRGSNGPRNRADEKLLQYFTLFNGGVVHIVTENDNELVSRSVEPNMEFYYRNVKTKFVKNPSKQRFSPSGMQSRFLNVLKESTGNFDSEKDQSFYSLVGENWMYAIEDILSNAVVVMKLIEDESSHVLLSLEDGWDRTLQASSVAQILLDPYYRTIYGFQVLLEKEWINGGHRFSDRFDSLGSLQDDRAPVFLQFLDSVWQLTLQYPTEFEFNEYYLRSIAHECFGQRFGTFAYSSALNRVEEEAVGLKSSSLWDYINIRHLSEPVFYNFRFMPPLLPVLRPKTAAASLCFWESFFLDQYYTALGQKGLVAQLPAVSAFQKDQVNDQVVDLLRQLKAERERIHKIKNPMMIRPCPAEYTPEWLDDWSSVAELQCPVLLMSANEVFGRTTDETLSAPSDNLLIDSPRGGASSPADASGSPAVKHAAPLPLAIKTTYKEVTLMKRGEKIRNWRMRTFVLDFKERTIIYYEKRGYDRNEKGRITDAIVDVCTKSDSKGDPNVFELHTMHEGKKGRVYELQAANPIELNNMIALFREYAAIFASATPPMTPMPVTPTSSNFLETLQSKSRMSGIMDKFSSKPAGPPPSTKPSFTGKKSGFYTNS